MLFAETVALPSSHKLHLWGRDHGLGAFPLARDLPVRVQHERSQRTISLASPLSSVPDEIIKPPTLWGQRPAESAVLSQLTGFGAPSPRLRPADRTVFQGPLAQHSTSYCREFGKPASLRVPALYSTKLPSALPPLER